MHSLHGQLLMVQDLSLALKVDNIKACFILSDISFHKLGPELDIVSVPKCTVCMFLLAVNLNVNVNVNVNLTLNYNFRFLEN